MVFKGYQQQKAAFAKMKPGTGADEAALDTKAVCWVLEHIPRAVKDRIAFEVAIRAAKAKFNGQHELYRALVSKVFKIIGGEKDA